MVAEYPIRVQFQLLPIGPRVVYCLHGNGGKQIPEAVEKRDYHREREEVFSGADMSCYPVRGLPPQPGNSYRDPTVWSKYAEKLSDFTKPPNIQAALQCLNELITNALQHVPDVIKYLSRLHNQSVFNFCAIPQVMAIATLAACYNNPQVFRGVVKIRKGQAVTLMLEATNMEAVKGMIRQYTQVIGQKVPGAGSSGARTQQIVVKVESLSQCDGELMSRSHLSPIYLSLAMFLAAVSWQYWQALTCSSEKVADQGTTVQNLHRRV
ncbi:squalene synthase-like [Carcharodon carcharias]|uniref:squalene synthase-like n=1 Tax=Carcharodon carcharias TaxID=13397 RepID=UPI001B7DF71B|nr:squalene synthase-like [Carcharodon carcharias]